MEVIKRKRLRYIRANAQKKERKKKKKKKEEEEEGLERERESLLTMAKGGELQRRTERWRWRSKKLSRLITVLKAFCSKLLLRAIKDYKMQTYLLFILVYIAQSVQRIAYVYTQRIAHHVSRIVYSVSCIAYSVSCIAYTNYVYTYVCYTLYI